MPDLPETCPAPTGVEVEHGGDITADETWAGDGTVHHVTFGVTIRAGATLTLDPCAVVRVDPGRGFLVRGDPGRPARLVANGTETAPVRIGPAEPGQRWGWIESLGADAIVDLAWTTLEDGGDGASHGATLRVRGGGDGTSIVPVLRADHLTITGSQGFGLLMEESAAFADGSVALTITNSGNDLDDAAIQVNPLAAGTLPPIQLSGNRRDQVRIASVSLAIGSDLTLRNVGAPYHFWFDRVRLTATLTVEPGVELRFDDYLVVGVENSVEEVPGRLWAVGTPAAPIVFTSPRESPAAGDWPGLYLLSAAGSRLENVEIRYAGGPNYITSANCRPAGTEDDAAVFIGSATGSYVPSADDFAGVTVTDSPGHGINAMWSAEGFGPDLTAGFAFGNLGGCRQTRNGRTAGCRDEQGCLVE